MRKLLAVIALMFLSAGLFSQNQYSGFSQYMFNGLALNPAYAGSREVLSMSLMYKKQWAGIENSPESQTFSLHTPLKKQRIGLGVFLMHEKLDIRDRTQAYLNYSFRFPAGKGMMSLGLRAGAFFESQDLARIILEDPDDPYFTNVPESAVLPNFGFGFYYYTSRFYLGASIPLLAEYEVDTLSSKYSASFDMEGYNYFLTAGALVVSTRPFKWKPSVLVKAQPGSGSYQVDLNSNFILFDDRLWVGASYRTDIENTGPALIGMIEVQLSDKVMIGYAYDYALSKMNNYLNGSHEIYLRYELFNKINAYNPRYF